MIATAEIRHWRDVVGFPDYEVSDDGRIRSMKKVGFAPAPTEPVEIVATRDTHGYRRLYLRRDGRTFSRKVAWLVLEAFTGPRPAKMDACHNDGDRSNDRLANLRWDTRKANLKDREAHGTVNRGGKNGAATLTEEQVRSIRAAVERGESQSLQAIRFGVNASTIGKIVRRERWGWLV